MAIDGTLNVDGGSLTVAGNVGGRGTLTIAAGTVDLGRVVAPGQTIRFAPGSTGGVLELGLAQRFAGTVAGLAEAKRLAITQVTGTGTADTDTIVTVQDGNLTATINLLNQFANQYARDAGAYTLASDQHGSRPGTLLELAAAHSA